MSAGGSAGAGGLRQAMAWLHTWSALWVSWVLFAIFLTGTLGVFDTAITRWMTPQLQDPSGYVATSAANARALRFGLAHLKRVAPDSELWSIGLPASHDLAIRTFWKDARGGFQSARLDPATGAAAARDAGRATEGGHHFVHMHFEFHAGTAGIWLVGVATLAMLVALVSGIVIHKRIFQDFFTFRPGKGQRSWLDAHNALAVLTLPFQLMIAYTGLCIFFATFMPAGILAHYRTTQSFYDALNDAPAERGRAGKPAAMLAPATLLARAEAALGRKASFMVIAHPNDAGATAQVFGPFDEGAGEKRLVAPDGGRILLDAVTGTVLDRRMPRAEQGGAASAVLRAMSALHMAYFGGYTAKWLYFLCGLAGAGMMATGSILFMIKRRRKALGEFGVHTARVYRALDTLNVAAIAGLCLACIAYLWANRLLPPGLPVRPEWEQALFFGAWAAALAHAAWRPPRHAWCEQLGLSGALCLTLPLLNAATTGDHLLRYLDRGDWTRAGVEGTCMALGAVLVLAARQVLAARRSAA